MNSYIILLTVLFVGCSHSIRVKTPINKLLSSESQGEFVKGNIQFFTVQGVEATVDLRNEKTNNSLSLDRNNSKALDIGLAGELGLWGPIDLVHVSGGTMGSDMTGFKVQFWGDKKNQAGKYNFSASVYAGYGAVINNVQEGEDLELVPLNDDTTSEFHITNQSAGLLVGYRPSEKILATIGYHIVNHNFSGVLESQNTNLDGSSLNYKGKSSIVSLTSFFYFEKAFLALEFSAEKLAWDHSDETSNIFTNIAGGFSW